MINTTVHYTVNNHTISTGMYNNVFLMKLVTCLAGQVLHVVQLG